MRSYQRVGPVLFEARLVGNGQLVATLSPAPCEDLASVLAAHPFTEAVLVSSLSS